MDKLLKAVHSTEDRFWLHGKRVTVMFAARDADHFADNRNEPRHLPRCVDVQTLICSGKALAKQLNEREYYIYGTYRDSVYIVFGYYLSEKGLFRPKTAYKANPFDAIKYKKAIRDLFGTI